LGFTLCVLNSSVVDKLPPTVTSSFLMLLAAGSPVPALPPFSAVFFFFLPASSFLRPFEFT
jgi:hypothetical protein